MMEKMNQQMSNIKGLWNIINIRLSTNRTIQTQDEEDIPEKKSYNPQYFKIQDRIKLLQQ